MSTVSEIKDAIGQLSIQDKAELRNWFVELDAAQWDQQFENDVQSGRLDWLKAEAKNDLHADRCTDR